ncbi:hypothetical protein [Nocardia thailandica]|uniref:hypothetical protein n=1 Tax=Nocardia thailandica TaxID=257275 RepID=UPI00030BD5BD|nr:hypothetical protein [Nocardia thailandica]
MNPDIIDYDYTAPAGPRRNDAAYTDGRTHRSKTNLTAALEVPAARERWREEGERVRLAFSKVRDSLNNAVTEDTTTVDMVLAAALDQAARKERVADDLLSRVVDAQERSGRAAVARVALATLDRMHAGELGQRFAEIADEMRAAVADEIAAVLADAVRLAQALDGIGTAEAAMSANKSAEWLERAALADRWMACQRSRVWLERATRDGFEALPGTDRIDRFRNGSAGIAVGGEVWRNQFADHHTRDTDDAAGVLSWYVAEINDGEHPEALV